MRAGAYFNSGTNFFIMYDIIISNTILVELNGRTFGSAGQRYFFSDVPELRGAKVYGIIAHLNASDYNTSTTGTTIIGTTQARQSLLTIVTEDSKQPVQRMPLFDLNPIQNGGLIRTFANIPINIQKSFVEITGTSGFSANDTFAFTFIYR
jgi:hypothetical protein